MEARKAIGCLYKKLRTIDEAYKPDGVTDKRNWYHLKLMHLYCGDRKEQKRQRQFAKENYIIDLMSGNIKIR